MESTKVNNPSDLKVRGQHHELILKNNYSYKLKLPIDEVFEYLDTNSCRALNRIRV